MTKAQFTVPLRCLLTLLVVFFAYFNAALVAQTDSLYIPLSKEQAQATAQAIRTGTLVVRLPTKRKTLAAMQDLYDNGDLTPENRSRLRIRIAETKADLAKSNASLMEHLLAYYHLSELRFMPDSFPVSLLSQSNAGFLVDPATGNLDPSLQISTSHYFLLEQGLAGPQESAYAEALLLLDAQGVPLRPPFKYAAKLQNSGFGLNSLLAPDIAASKRIERSVRRLVKKLNGVLSNYR